MGLFDAFRKKPSVDNRQQAKAQFKVSEPVVNTPQDGVISINVRLKGCVPSENGLYPHEILMLHYAEKYKTQGNSYQQFWLYDYGVNNPESVLKSLIQRGFVTVGSAESCVRSEKVATLKELLVSKGAKATGKKEDLISRVLETFSEAELDSLFPIKNYALTDLGAHELANNEYVAYLHAKKYFELDPFKMNAILGGDNRRYRDAIWGFFNKRLGETFRAADYVGYAMTLNDMSKFLAEEERFKDAIRVCIDLAYVDMNLRANQFYSLGKSYALESLSSLFPYEDSLAVIRPGVIKDVTTYQDKLGMSNAELFDFIAATFCRSDSSIFPIAIFSKEECVEAFFFEKMGDRESLSELYDKAEQRYRRMLR